MQLFGLGPGSRLEDETSYALEETYVVGTGYGRARRFTAGDLETLEGAALGPVWEVAPEAGLPFVDVIAPEQDISTGAVQLVVLEFRVGQIRVEGNEHFSAALLRERFGVRPGEDDEDDPGQGDSVEKGEEAKAPKRVLVVADSCYAGLLSSDPGVNVFGTDTQSSLDYLKYKLPKRSRLLLSSGGDQPVLDSGGEGNSVFARAFIDVLEANSDVLSTPALFARLQKQVRIRAARSHFEQKPEFKSIKSAGHEVGDFFFVPANPPT